MIRVHRADRARAGGCTACPVSAEPTETVLVIHLESDAGGGGLQVRLCDFCATDLRSQIPPGLTG